MYSFLAYLELVMKYLLFLIAMMLERMHAERTSPFVLKKDINHRQLDVEIKVEF
jgi:hypothetical protein